MTYTVAADGADELRRINNNHPIPPIRVPRGTSHAVEAGAAGTVCGLPLGSFALFPTLDWEASSILHKCDSCRERLT